jgi:hypothetical protein
MYQPAPVLPNLLHKKPMSKAYNLSLKTGPTSCLRTYLSGATTFVIPMNPFSRKVWRCWNLGRWAILEQVIYFDRIPFEKEAKFYAWNFPLPEIVNFILTGNLDNRPKISLLNHSWIWKVNVCYCHDWSTKIRKLVWRSLSAFFTCNKICYAIYEFAYFLLRPKKGGVQPVSTAIFLANYMKALWDQDYRLNAGFCNTLSIIYLSSLIKIDSWIQVQSTLCGGAIPASRKRRQRGNTVSDETVMYGYWSSVIALYDTDPSSRQRGRPTGRTTKQLLLEKG